MVVHPPLCASTPARLQSAGTDCDERPRSGSGACAVRVDGHPRRDPAPWAAASTHQNRTATPRLTTGYQCTTLSLCCSFSRSAATSLGAVMQAARRRVLAAPGALPGKPKWRSQRSAAQSWRSRRANRSVGGGQLPQATTNEMRLADRRRNTGEPGHDPNSSLAPGSGSLPSPAWRRRPCTAARKPRKILTSLRSNSAR